MKTEQERNLIDVLYTNIVEKREKKRESIEIDKEQKIFRGNGGKQGQ